MSMTLEEGVYEDFIAQLYEEHKKEAIEEFTVERLQSYYLKNKLLAKPALQALKEARNLVKLNVTAGFIFGAISMEVGLKATLLKPIVYGLVHIDSIAGIITDLTISHTGMDRYRNLLSQILKDHGAVDLDNYKREGTNKSFWEEIKEVQKVRNLVVHRGQLASVEQAELSINVASEILEKIFPKILNKIGLHLHDDFRVCDDWKCKYAGTEMEKLIKGT